MNSHSLFVVVGGGGGGGVATSMYCWPVCGLYTMVPGAIIGTPCTAPAQYGCWLAQDSACVTQVLCGYAVDLFHDTAPSVLRYECVQVRRQTRRKVAKEIHTRDDDWHYYYYY